MTSADIRPASPAMIPKPYGVPTSAAAIVVPAQAAYVPTATPISQLERIRAARANPSMPSRDADCQGEHDAVAGERVDVHGPHGD